MKLKVGIVGYGNLGKALEKQISKNPEYELVDVFSRRKLDCCKSYDCIMDYKDEIDLLFLCSGSQSDLEQQVCQLVQHFNIIECYDNHSRMSEYLPRIDELAKENKKIALCGFGWDPGLFSLMRGLFDSLGFSPTTFWGRGLSQGHTQAIKNVDGVIDGLQFTIPNEKAMRAIKSGMAVDFASDRALHKRVCYVVANPIYWDEIRQKICNMPAYFLGYETIVKFVSQQKLDKLKSFAHKGQIVTKGDVINFSLNLESNPDFTARVLQVFARNFKVLNENQEYGAYSIFDLPVKNILLKDEIEYI